MKRTTRRNFLQTLTLSAAALSCIGNHATAQSHPNIIFILADDKGFGDVACQNPESKIPTPNLDRLASQGIRFTDAHSPSAVCTPTRYSILTGRYCWRSRLKRSVLWPWDEPLIEPDRLTVGRMLQEAGYSTACIGKWHLGWEWQTKDGSKITDQFTIGEYSRTDRAKMNNNIDFTKPIKRGPTEYGFDYYFGDDVPNFPPYTFIENDTVMRIPMVEKPDDMFGDPGPMAEGWELDQVMPTITQKAVDYIKSKPGSNLFGKKENAPFFLYFTLTAPHTPIAPDKQFHGKSEAGAYGDFVHQVDWTVGQVMQALDESGQAENTLIIFTSDNGSPARDGSNMQGKTRSVLQYGHNPSHIYRGIKADIWEGGHRVPFIARWQNKIKPGAVSDETVCLVDFMATCAELIAAQLPNDAGEDSYNLLPALLREDYSSPIREATVHHSINGTFAIRQGQWKLILGKGSGGWSGRGDKDDPPMQLYNLKNDPSEQKNLYHQHPDIVERLERLLVRYQKEGRSTAL